MSQILIFLTILLLMCHNTVRAQVGLSTDSIRIDGNFRTFHFNKSQVSNENTSLVFVLHGSGGGGRLMAEATGKLASLAVSENFLLVYPDGYKKFWNECRKTATSQANVENIDEVEFFESMINYFNTHYNINPRRVFAVGTSGGGHMAYKLAMTTPHKFRAITAIIANLPDDQNMDCEELKVALPVMIINGTADAVNPYNGGMMQTGNFKAGTVRSTEKTFQYWAGLAGYDGQPSKDVLPDTDQDDGKTIERYVFKKNNKPEVVLLKVIGGKHDYPGDVDVHLEAWKFFKRQLNRE